MFHNLLNIKAIALWYRRKPQPFCKLIFKGWYFIDNNNIPYLINKSYTLCSQVMCITLYTSVGKCGHLNFIKKSSKI